jgi:hypothetical protein
MKSSNKFLCSLVIFLATQTFAANIPLKIDGILLPHQGFDDNDVIELVIDTHLPNICFRATTPQIKIDETTKIISITAFATKRDLAECQIENLATPYQFPVQYSENLKIGVLSEGKYTIVFGQTANEQTFFEVEKASMTSIDEKLYAPIGQVFVPEMISSKDDVQVILTGVLNNSCMGLLEKNIKVIPQGDVFVILPVLTYLQRSDCQAISRPFQFIISLGKQKIGRYLLHTRSLSGNSINRLFSVKSGSQADSESSF